MTTIVKDFGTPKLLYLKCIFLFQCMISTDVDMHFKIINENKKQWNVKVLQHKYLHSNSYFHFFIFLTSKKKQKTGYEREEPARWIACSESKVLFNTHCGVHNI